MVTGERRRKKQLPSRLGVALLAPALVVGCGPPDVGDDARTAPRADGDFRVSVDLVTAGLRATVHGGSIAGNNSGKNPRAQVGVRKSDCIVSGAIGSDKPPSHPEGVDLVSVKRAGSANGSVKHFVRAPDEKGEALPIGSQVAEFPFTKSTPPYAVAEEGTYAVAVAVPQLFFDRKIDTQYTSGTATFTFKKNGPGYDVSSVDESGTTRTMTCGL